MNRHAYLAQTVPFSAKTENGRIHNGKQRDLREVCNRHPPNTAKEGD